MRKTLRNIFIFVLLFAAIVFIFCSFYIPLSQDEGVFLTISENMLNRLLPYRDFFDHKPPGIYFILAPFVKVFSINAIYCRFFVLLVNLLSAFFVYKISETLKKSTGAIAFSVYLFLVYIFEGYYLIAEPFLALFLSVSLLLLLRGSKSKTNIVFAGVFASLAVVLKQPALLSVIPLAYFAYARRKEVKDLLYFTGGFFTPLIVLLVWVSANNLMGAFIEQVFIANIYYPRQPFNEVLPKVLGTLYSAWFMWVLLFVFIFWVKSKNKIVLLLLVFLPMPMYLLRDYAHYWLQSVPFIAVCSGAGVYELIKRRRVMFVVFILIFAITSFSTIKWFSWMYKNVWFHQSIEQDRAKEYLKSLKGSYMVAENRFIPFYFLSNKKPVTKFLYVTEITDHYISSKKIAEKIKGSNNDIILWPSDGNIYSKEIDSLVKEKYVKVQSYGSLKMDVYLRR